MENFEEFKWKSLIISQFSFKYMFFGVEILMKKKIL